MKTLAYVVALVACVLLAGIAVGDVVGGAANKAFSPAVNAVYMNE